MSEDRQRRLGQLGYSFNVTEKDVTDPRSQHKRYYTVAILQGSRVIGERSEMTYERALERAMDYAQQHHEGIEPGVSREDWQQPNGQEPGAAA